VRGGASVTSNTRQIRPMLWQNLVEPTHDSMKSHSTYLDHNIIGLKTKRTLETGVGCKPNPRCCPLHPKHNRCQDNTKHNKCIAPPSRARPPPFRRVSTPPPPLRGRARARDTRAAGGQPARNPASAVTRPAMGGGSPRASETCWAAVLRARSRSTLGPRFSTPAHPVPLMEEEKGGGYRCPVCNDRDLQSAKKRAATPLDGARQGKQPSQQKRIKRVSPLYSPRTPARITLQCQGRGCIGRRQGDGQASAAPMSRGERTLSAANPHAVVGNARGAPQPPTSRQWGEKGTRALSGTRQRGG